MAAPSNRPGNRRRQSFSEINVAPLVDVMLVLLIVFMVTSPLMTSGMEIDLPRDPATALEVDKVDPLSVNLDAQGRIFLQDTDVALDESELLVKLRAIVSSNPDTRVVVRADRQLPYERIMAVLAVVGNAGIVKVALQSART